MSDRDNAELAAEQARQAGSQAKAAAQNAGKAVAEAAEPLGEEAAEKAKAVAAATRKMDLGETALGLSFGSMAMSLSLLSGVVAYRVFRDTIKGVRGK